MRQRLEWCIYRPRKYQDIQIHTYIYIYIYIYMKVKVAQSCPTLCDPLNYTIPGSFVHGILQARILEWIAVPFFREFSQPRDQTQVSLIAGGFFIIWATSEALYMCVYVCVCVCVCVTWKKVKLLLAQSCLTLWDPMNCSSPGSSVHGISQARILEWIAIPFSRRSYQPRDQSWVSCIAGRFFTIWATREARK